MQNQEKKNQTVHSRVIKFRAWNKKDSNLNTRMIYSAILTKEGRVVMPDGDEWDIPVMQFTGLLDKNGNEIYVSDLVKSGNDEIWEVRDGEWIKYCGDDEHKLFGLHLWNIVERNYDNEQTGLYKGIRLEVIGNIWETPELLIGNLLPKKHTPLVGKN